MKCEVIRAIRSWNGWSDKMKWEVGRWGDREVGRWGDKDKMG